MSGDRHQVHVFDEGDWIETCLCRLVTLPNGEVGAVWRGLAFTLDENDRIDVSQPGTPPSECRAPPVAAKKGNFVILPADEDAWVLIAGPAAARDLALAILKSSGVSILRHGRWMGEDVEGIEADWFIRVAHPPNSEPFERLAAALDAPGFAAEVPAAVRLRLVQAELAESRAREAALRAELARVSIQLSQRRDPVPAVELTGEEISPTDSPAPIEVVVSASDAAPVGEDPSEVAAKLPPAKPRKALRGEIESVFEVMLSRILLLRDSITVVSGEFRDRKSLYRCLGELNLCRGELPTGWKKLRDTKDWWERHVSDGEDDSGRLYARRSPSEGKWEVLVSHKEQQARDIAWLRRNTRA